MDVVKEKKSATGIFPVESSSQVFPGSGVVCARNCWNHWNKVGHFREEPGRWKAVQHKRWGGV